MRQTYSLPHGLSLRVLDLDRVVDDDDKNKVGDKQRIKFFADCNEVGQNQVPYAQRVRNIGRHPCNCRQQSGVKATYVASCKHKGIVEGVRGEPWLVTPTPDVLGEKKGPFLALSFGSLTESFYQALLEDPENDNLRLSLTRGLESRLLHHATPIAVLKFLVAYRNRFHTGSATSFLEMLWIVPDAICLGVLSTFAQHIFWSLD